MVPANDSGTWPTFPRMVNGEAPSPTHNDQSHDSMPPLSQLLGDIEPLPALNRSDSSEDTLILEQPEANRYS